MRWSRSFSAVALLAASLVLTGCQAGGGPSSTWTTGVAPTTVVPTTVAPPSAQATAAATLPAATATAAGSTGTAIHLVKDCSAFNAEIPSYCKISSSDYAPIPIGANVIYLGPLLDNQYFLSSNVRIDDGHGNTATGYCIFDGRPTEDRGFCTFWAGKGALAGFTAIFKVSIDSAGEWHLDGEYYGIPPSPGPS